MTAKSGKMISCALDIGSSQVKAALGRYDRREGLFEILAVEAASSTGVRRGVVSDMTGCTQAIAKVLDKVQSKSGTKFDYLFLSIPGSQINLSIAKGACLLEKEKRISRKEIEHAIRSSVEFYLPFDRKLIQVITTEFIVDGQRGISNPLGMFGRKIEVQTILMHAQVQLIANLIVSIEEAGYTINELIVCPQAQAEFLLSPPEKESGAILLDIGEQMVNFSFFKNEAMSEIKSFKTGVGDIIKNISLAFEIPYEYASNLHKRHFSLSSVAEESEEKILLKRENAGYESISRKDFCLKGFESSRRIFALVEKYIKRRPKGCNVVFLGGAALVDGFPEKLAARNVNLRIASPLSEKIRFSNPAFNNPLFSNSICACAYGFKLLNERRLTRLKGRPFLSRFFLQIRDVIEEYF